MENQTLCFTHYIRRYITMSFYMNQKTERQNMNMLKELY